MKSEPIHGRTRDHASQVPHYVEIWRVHEHVVDRQRQIDHDKLHWQGNEKYNDDEGGEGVGELVISRQGREENFAKRLGEESATHAGRGRGGIQNILSTLHVA